jgi:SAM-dependent methyltransferase
MPLIVSRRAFVAGLAWTWPALALQNRREPQVPYVPTPPEVVEGMLNLAGLRAGEQLVDLGSGDGRIVLAAARRGAQARGVELDPELVERARRRAELEQLQASARFVRGDLFAESLRDAQVVTLYLLPAINARLRPKLLNELKAGSRVVSHAFDMGDWAPDQMQVVDDKQIFLWIVPAVAGGAWRLTGAGGKNGVLQIVQQYQRVTGSFDGRPIEAPELRGARLFFRLDGIGYQGLVGDRTIAPDPAADYLPQDWRAERIG